MTRRSLLASLAAIPLISRLPVVRRAVEASWAPARTVFVGPAGSGAGFTTLAAALDSIRDSMGSTVYVMAGHRETINQTLPVAPRAAIVGLGKPKPHFTFGDAGCLVVTPDPEPDACVFRELKVRA